jgi:ATP-dependent helicase/DNAse subunit B
VERLAACGFKFFAHDVLRLRAVEEADVDIGPRDRGDLLHQAIQIVLTEVDPLPASLDEARELGRRVLRARQAVLLDGLPPKAEEIASLSWETIEQAVDELLVLEHARRQARDPTAVIERRLEWPFEFTISSAGELPAIQVQGRIDRVELERAPGAQAVLEIIDYKGSRDRTAVGRALNPEGALGVTAFQIPLYLEAGRRLLLRENEQADLRGALVAVLAPPGEREKVTLRTLDEEKLAEVTRVAQQLVAAAAAGRFDVDPVECDRWCPYRVVCRYQPPPLEDEGRG